MALMVTIGTWAAGNGTKENPYSCAEVLKLSDDTNGWVIGYITGTHNTIYGMLLSDDTDGTSAIAVKLAAGDQRKFLNPTTDPTCLNKKVMVKGSVGSYAGKEGLASISEYEFVATETFTVSFDAGAGSYAGADLIEANPGEGITLPSATISAEYEGWSFAGWAEEAAAGETIEPTLYAAGETYNPEAHITLYAVYQKAGEIAPSNNFTKISTADDLVSGDDYLIVGNSEKAMPCAEANSSDKIAGEAISVSSNVIATNDAALVWKITKDNSNYTLFNADQSKYLSIASGALGIADAAVDFTLSVNEVVFEFKADGKSLSYYGGNFNAYSKPNTIHVYKRNAPEASAIYDSNPKTASEPTYEASESTLEFGDVYFGESADLTFTLQGKNLTGDEVLLESDNDVFSLSTESVAVTEGTIAETTITVTFTPDAGQAETGEITILGNEVDLTINLTGTGVLPQLTTPVATTATDITKNSFTASWDAVADATSYEVNVTYLSEGAGVVGDGTEAKPYTVAEFIAANPTGTVFVKGYMVGYATSKLAYNTTGISSDSNFALADETGEDKTFVPVQLQGDFQDDWGLKSNPSYLNQFVVVEASAEQYFSTLGLKSTKSITAASTLVATPITGSPFTVTDGTSLSVTGLTANTTYKYSVVAKADNYIDSEVSNAIEVITSSGTGICTPTTIEGVSFDGRTIRNAKNAELHVFNAIGALVVSSTNDIDASALQGGMYIVRSAGATLKIMVK